MAGKQLLADLFVREQSQIGKLPEAEGLARDPTCMPHRVQVFPNVFMLMVLVILTQKNPQTKISSHSLFSTIQPAAGLI